MPVSWLFADSIAKVERFVDFVDLDLRDVFMLGSPRHPIEGTRAAGFVATPTRMVFGADRYVFDVRATQQIPTSSMLKEMCDR
jgi:hypothetical protein